MTSEEKFNKALVKLLELTKTGKIKWYEIKNSKNSHTFFCYYNNKMLKLTNKIFKGYTLNIFFMSYDLYTFPEEEFYKKGNLQKLYNYLLEKSNYVEELINKLLKEE